MSATLDSLTVTGTVTLSGTFVWPTTFSGNGCPRAQITQEDSQKYDLPLKDFVVHDAPATALPGTAAADDFGVYGVTFGTDAIHLRTIDEKGNLGTHSVRGRTTFRLPKQYVAGQPVQIVVAAGMMTTVADTTATVDVECHLAHTTDGTVGADLVTTSAITINVLPAALKTFTVNPAGLNPGDLLEIRISTTIHDNATGTAVIGRVNAAYVLCSTKG